MKAVAPRFRFREARENLGLSPDELATQVGVSASAVWDIEERDGDLTACYSPKDVQTFCRVLGISPVELFGAEVTEPAIPADELVRRIHEECRSRGVTLHQFEDAVGWQLSACIEPPEKLLKDMTTDGLQWLCRELRIEWHRVLLSL